MRTIKLHGALGKEFAEKIELECSNMFQVMTALESRFGPRFKEVIRTGRWHVVDGAVKPGNDLSEETLQRPLKNRVLHIMPVVEGRNSTVRIILGAVLIAVGTYFGQTWMVQAGWAMVIGGVVEMLVKPKGMDQSKKLDQAQSSLFNGARNVTTQGGPIPLIYGRVRRASSVVISSDFSSAAVVIPQEVIDVGSEGPIP
jgi:predicted phage tail protein